MNGIQIFNNLDFGEIRTLEEGGKVLFCGKDVAKALGYVNAPDAIAKHCKKDGIAKHDSLDSLGRKNTFTFVNEGNLYRLISHSKLPTAEKFESWIFDEVLPQIRKTGGYIPIEEEDTEQELLAKAYLISMKTIEEQKNKLKAMKDTVEVQGHQISEMKPKASYYDVVLNCKDLISVTLIAKDYGKSADWLNKYLYKKSVQYKQSGTWFLYQDYAGHGYTGSKTHSYNGNDGKHHTKEHTYWTQKGRLFIYNLLKEDGIIPVMEQINAA